MCVTTKLISLGGHLKDKIIIAKSTKLQVLGVLGKIYKNGTSSSVVVGATLCGQLATI